MKVTLITSLLMDYVNGRLTPIAMDKLRSCPPYGIYLLATVLRHHGHEAVVADLVAQGSLSLAAFDHHIAASHLVGISATSLSWPSALEMILALKHRYPETPIVVGGVHATMFDDYILSTYPVDYVIRGEGERALPALARAIETGADLLTVPSLSIVHDGRVVRTALAPPIGSEEMGRFPLPDYGTVPLAAYKGVAFESSRGCPFSCSFCSTPYRASWRGLPPEECVNRLERLEPYRAQTELGCIHIIDDEFSADRRRATRIARLLTARGRRPSLIFDARANDLLHEEFTAEIKPHTYQLLVGAECGYDEGLAQVGKGTTCAKLEQAAATAYRHGMSDRCDFSFILGLPWETKEDVLKTVRFACRLYAAYGVNIILQWFSPIPGSPLWEQLMRESPLNISFYDHYGFFRSPELFFGAVKLHPQEIWEIADILRPIRSLASVNDRGEERIHHSVPEAVKAYYHPNALAYNHGNALEHVQALSAHVREYKEERR